MNVHGFFVMFTNYLSRTARRYPKKRRNGYGSIRKNKTTQALNASRKWCGLRATACYEMPRPQDFWEQLLVMSCAGKDNEDNSVVPQLGRVPFRYTTKAVAH